MLKVFNTPDHPCLRPNPARDDGVWPGGPFYMVENVIYFHRQDAERRLRELAEQRD